MDRNRKHPYRLLTLLALVCKQNKKDDKKQWGQHLYRYISDETAARVLLDIVNIKEGAEKENALRVLRHYCRIKGLDINNIPPASGVI